MSPCSSSSISGSALSSSNTSRPKDSRQRRGDSVLRYVPKAYSPVGFPPSVERAAFDIVIVGGGAAGLRAAIAAAQSDLDLSIAVVSKVYPMRSHTVSAEGGTAAVLRDYDSLELHALDTIKGSDFLADQDAVEFFVARCPKEIIQLEHWGCPWSRDPDGRVYEFTTNGFIKTGDGMALAYRAGVPLKDMEMVQFHPTCLPGTGILITEAARGEGGYLINKDGERYMQRYLPTKMELGPRDILSRSMIQEIKAGRAFEGPYGPYLGLDLRHLGAATIEPLRREEARVFDGLMGRERGKETLAGVRVEMQQLMERVVGIFRDEAGLADACGKLGKLRDRFSSVGLADKDHVFNTEMTGVLELDFMLDVAASIAHSALNRRESRGAHSRTDFPARDDVNYLKHTLVYRTDGAPRIDYSPVKITKWQPVARTY